MRIKQCIKESVAKAGGKDGKYIKEMAIKEMAMPSKDLEAYVCNPDIQLKTLSAFLQTAGAVGPAKIKVMQSNIPAPQLSCSAYAPGIEANFVALNKEFGGEYEYLVGFAYVPVNTEDGVYNGNDNDWIFFNKYTPFAGNKIRKMQMAAPGDVMKQINISLANLMQYRLASILFPVRKLS